MAVKSIYRKYFQKSRVFLYPLLNIENDSSVMPIDTYICWEDNYAITDNKLICLYHIRDDQEFIKFEKKKLLGNKLFHDFKNIEKGKGIYIFDLKDYKKDFVNFTQGKYSLLSDTLKGKVMDYYSSNKSTQETIESYLDPEKYYENYSDILGISINILKQAKELCDKPDMDKEKCQEKINNIELKLEL